MSRSGFAFHLTAQHDVTKGQRIEETGFVCLADDPVGQSFGRIGAEQNDMDLVCNLDILFLFGGQDLEIDDVRIFQRDP